MTKVELSRRSLLHNAATVAGIVTVFATKAKRATAQVQVKSPPQVAGYQNQPNGGQRCGGCRHFQPPATCKVVAGRISPNGWCKLYFAKSA